mmetsp:Transcript_44409/g.74061  ORF Transcript_44409/g.74061 Transcript_44409/m.74061 type:complete len:319 (+) Transcript_44409:342-1298(+)|eukprot:CAMPEP_0198224562 /NCGR_PEP_ID=MMETSP1445-20131203/97455_1 /TAXON_ID=36898 /ORGANISM="Pyramimonas sp., Strain CCMP2087" /LENGTH=318 /DNA_ID=CAMNT_0043903783 /DNA_START=258 /DNA_END=1214 /DNA_ORIENTATION=-
MTAQINQVTRTEKGLGRFELVTWLNQTLQTDYANVQECADGVAYCQLIDSVLPRKVPLHKLNFNARFHEDNVKNLTLLETNLRRLNVNKQLDVEALAKGRFKENNEMLQWAYTFVQRNCPEAPLAYQALERRMEAQAKQKLPQNKHQERGVIRKPSQPYLQQNQMPNEAASFAAVQSSNSGANGDMTGGMMPPRFAPRGPQLARGGPSETREEDHPARVRSRHRLQEECATPPPPEGGEEGHVAAEQKCVELERLISFLEHQLTGRLTVHMQKQAEVRVLEKERNFYVNKLHRVEEACQADNSLPLAQRALQILSTRV